MKNAKLPWPVLALITLLIPLALACSQSGVLPTGKAPGNQTPSSANAMTIIPTAEPWRYSTKELVLKSGNPQGMILWEGKLIYSDVTIEYKPEYSSISRIVEHDMASGQDTPLIEAQPPHNSAYSLHRSGDWLFYVEEGTTEPGSATFNPPRDYYAFNLRTEEKRPLLMLRGGSCSGFQSGPDYSGNAFGDNGFAYVTGNISDNECRDQLRVYNIETGEDRMLLDADSPDTVFQSPMLRGDKVIFGQAWRAKWPPDVTPTPQPDRPGPPAKWNVTGDIYSLDLNTGEKVNLSNTGSASQPALWGDYLMWIDEPSKGAQEHGSGEVYVRNIKTGQLQKLTTEATYMHLYNTPLAGDSFFVWGDAHQIKDKLPVYFPESDEIVYLQGPGSGPTVINGRPDGKTLFWSWSDWSGVATQGPGSAVVDSEQVKDRPWKVFMTTFE